MSFQIPGAKMGGHFGGGLAQGGIMPGAFTFAQLPPATSFPSLRAMITDSNTAVFMAAAAGGGANIVPVFSNGTNWIVG